MWILRYALKKHTANSLLSLPPHISPCSPHSFFLQFNCNGPIITPASSFDFMLEVCFSFIVKKKFIFHSWSKKQNDSTIFQAEQWHSKYAYVLIPRTNDNVRLTAVHRVQKTSLRITHLLVALTGLEQLYSWSQDSTVKGYWLKAAKGKVDGEKNKGQEKERTRC